VRRWVSCLVAITSGARLGTSGSPAGRRPHLVVVAGCEQNGRRDPLDADSRPLDSPPIGGAWPRSARAPLGSRASLPVPCPSRSGYWTNIRGSDLSPADPLVSRELAASEAEEAAVAKRQPVAVAAGAAARSILRPAPPESRRQAARRYATARGEPFFRQRRTSVSSEVEGLEHTTTLRMNVEEAFGFPPDGAKCRFWRSPPEVDQ
jgi:hypothetical protein